MPHLRDLLGWLSSIVLLATIVQQIATQWKERTGKGVSRWLFVGQTVASLGFTVYSALLGNLVFTITNALLFVSAIVGWGMTLHFKRANAAPHKAQRAAERAALQLEHALTRPSPNAASVRTVPSRYAR